MKRFLLLRFGLAIVTLFGISVVAFLIITLPPGDFIDSYVARAARAGSFFSPEQIASLRHSYGLDAPMWVQYLKWTERLLRGDFGRSLAYNLPVSKVLAGPLLYTLILSIMAQIFTWALALPAGILSAVFQYSVFDYAISIIVLLGLGVPAFMIALLLMYFAYDVSGVAITGLFSQGYEFAPWGLGKAWNMFEHLLAPSLVMAMGGMAYTVRVLRANLLDELSKPYVTTARAKGLTEAQVVLRHPLRVALNPLISSTGFIFPQLVSGGLVVSVVMGLPTVGPILVRALLGQDLFLAATIIVLVGAMTVVGVLISDLLLAAVDPRIRLS